MKSLRISASLSLPIDTVTSTLIVYGGKGMGKTNLGSVLVEELSRVGLRWSVLDPLGVWWGLRHSADGKGSGVECLVLGGSHADIPIEPTGGAIVADLVIDEPANVVIDFSRKPSGEMWGVGERIRFVTDYAYRLFQRQGELVKGLRREPVFQVLDESARYIPQIIPSGAIDLAKCVNAWEQIVEEGRNIGIGVCLLTQRSARMNKSVSELADAVLAFRIVGPNSIDAITDWLGEHVPKPQVKSMVETIRSLERGHCLVVSPGWLKFEGVVGIRHRNTFDSSATPKPGERARRVHGEGAKPDLAKYVERMKATIEKAKADDPNALRKRIKELERLAGKPAGINMQPAKPLSDPKQAQEIRQLRSALEDAMKIIARISIKGFKDSGIDPEKLRPVIQKAADEVARLAKQHLNAQAKELALLASDAERMLKRVQAITQKDTTVHVEIARKESIAISSEPKSSPVRPARSHPITPSDGISTSQQRILNSLAELEQIGMEKADKTLLAVWCKCSPTSGGYYNNLGFLRSTALVDYPASGQVALTQEGRAKSQSGDAPMSTDELFERASSILSASQAAILNELRRSYPKAVAKQEIATALGVSPTSGGFFNNLGKLRSSGMIDYPAAGTAKAAEWLFALEK